MEEIVIQHTELIWIIWICLNFPLYFFKFLNCKIYCNLINFGSVYKYQKKIFFDFLVWIITGTAIVFAYKRAISEKDISVFWFLVWVGGLYFIVIGCLLKEIILLVEYFIYKGEISKRIPYSFKSSLMLSSIDFLEYAILILLCFFVTKSPFLLGGSIGFAFISFSKIIELMRRKM